MKRYFIKNKLYTGGSDRTGIPLCHSLGKAVFTHATSEINSPFIMVSRGDSSASEVLQIAVGDAICNMGGEVLLVDSITVAAAQLLTKKYRADFTIAIDNDYIEVFDKNGQNLTSQAEQNIERIIENRTAISEGQEMREGEFYSRRDAYLDYTSTLIEILGRTKIRTKIAIGGKGKAMQKSARQIFSRLSKNVISYEGEPEKSTITKTGADIAFYFDRTGRRLTIFNTHGDTVSPEDAYCLLVAKLAEKDPLGNSLKSITGIKIQENGDIHFSGDLQGADALFTAILLSTYQSDKDEPLHKLIDNLKNDVSL